MPYTWTPDQIMCRVAIIISGVNKEAHDLINERAAKEVIAK
jgi:hypothetical protein